MSKKSRVGYVYIEESFDTIFNMDYEGGGRTTQCLMGRENHPCFRGLIIRSHVCAFMHSFKFLFSLVETEALHNTYLRVCIYSPHNEY